MKQMATTAWYACPGSVLISNTTKLPESWTAAKNKCTQVVPHLLGISFDRLGIGFQSTHNSGGRRKMIP